MADILVVRKAMNVRCKASADHSEAPPQDAARPSQAPHGNHKPGNESCLQILNLEDCNAIRCVRG